MMNYVQGKRYKDNLKHFLKAFNIHKSLDKRLHIHEQSCAAPSEKEQMTTKQTVSAKLRESAISGNQGQYTTIRRIFARAF